MSTPVMLIEQLQPSETNIIQQSSNDGKKMWLSGVFMQSETKNRNGRVYPLKEITEAVRVANETIKQNNGIFGELDHPQSLTINSDRVSHYISELWMQGNDAFGKARLLNTPMGLIAQELIKSGVRVGVSSRGAGNVNESGGVSGYQLVTVDLVLSPSAPNAYPNTVYEALQTQTGNKVMTLAEQLQQDESAQKYFRKEILNWLKSL